MGYIKDSLILQDLTLALDQKIYDLRKEKLKQIEALGQLAYPYRFETTHSVPQIVDEYSPKTAEELEAPRIDVRVAGRIMSIRVHGQGRVRAHPAGRQAPADLRAPRQRRRKGLPALQAARSRRLHRREAVICSAPAPAN